MNKLLFGLLLVSGVAQAGDWGNDEFFNQTLQVRTVAFRSPKPAKTKLEATTEQPNKQQESASQVEVTPVKDTTISFKPTSTSIEFKPAGEVNVLKVDNQEYAARRAEALKKPGAVVAQVSIN
jgi:hypothetical protein